MISKDLVEKAKSIQPLIRIGKNGITKAQLDEIMKQLRKKKLVKIKFLRSFLETTGKKKAASELAAKTGSEIVLQVGFVLVLLKT